jgi:ketosteroid isomerase-like protein
MKTQINGNKNYDKQTGINLPKAIADLVMAQNNFDSAAYADCFAETAIVFDEGHVHEGRTAIRNWIEAANRKYKAMMRPVRYSASSQVLEAEISGNFPGSPLVLQYQLVIKDEEIQSLKIVG